MTRGGPGMAHRDDPRNSAGAREVEHSETRMPGALSLNQSYNAPNTFFAKLVAAPAGFCLRLASCLAIISNNPSSACSVT